MNCKPGDLAVVVNSKAGNDGKLVTCIRLARAKILNRNGAFESGPIWEVDKELASFSGSRDRYIADRQLRPIRDPGEDAQDETLLWAGSPVKEVA